MPKITKKTGRQSIDEFGLEGEIPSPPLADPAGPPFPDPQEPPTPEGDGPGTPIDGEGPQDLEGFKFLNCDPQIPGEEPETCPVCRENEFAYVPDFRLLENGDVFFDGKNCTQNVVMTVDSPVLDGPTVAELEDPQRQDIYKRMGVELLFNYFNKADIVTIYTYEKIPFNQGEQERIIGAVLGAALEELNLAQQAAENAARAAEDNIDPSDADLADEDADLADEEPSGNGDSIAGSNPYQQQNVTQQNQPANELVALLSNLWNALRAPMRHLDDSNNSNVPRISDEIQEFVALLREERSENLLYFNSDTGTTVLDDIRATNDYLLAEVEQRLPDSRIDEFVETTTAVFEVDPDILIPRIRQAWEDYDAGTLTAYEQAGGPSLQDTLANNPDAYPDLTEDLEVATETSGAGLPDDEKGDGSIGDVIPAQSTTPARRDATRIPTPVQDWRLITTEKSSIEELLPYIQFKYHIPAQLKARTRILISAPVEIFDRIPAKIFTQPTAQFQTNLEVTIKGEEFFPMVRRLSNALKYYANKYDRWVTLDGGRLIEKKQTPVDPYGNPIPYLEVDYSFLNMRRESEKLLSFAETVESMIKNSSGLTFADPDNFRGNFSNTNIEKITFRYNSEGDDIYNSKLTVKEIVANKHGCPDVVFSETSQAEYGTGTAFQKNITDKTVDTRTLFFVGALPQIDVDIRAREQIPWLDFVIKYVYPAVEVYNGVNPNTLLNDPTSLACLGDAAAASVNNPGETFLHDLIAASLGIGISLPDAIVENFNKRSCNTRAELIEEYKKIATKEEGEEYAKKYKQQLNRVKETLRTDIIQVEEPALDIILEEIQAAIAKNKTSNAAQVETLMNPPEGSGQEPLNKREARKQARKDKKGKVTIKELWEKIFDRLGVCGFLDLVMSAADCVAQGLGEETALNALIKAAFDAMDDIHLERIFVGLPPETQERIFNRIRGELGDIPAPWDIGYIQSGISIEDIEEAQTAPSQTREQKQEEDKQLLDDLTLSPNPRLTPQYASGNPLARSLGGIQKEIFNAYREAILDVTEMDQILEQLNKLPGAPIASALINQFARSPCSLPVPGLSFNPRLDSFLNTIEADLCKWNGKITLPALNPVLPTGEQFREAILNLFRILGLAVYEALKEVALALSMQILKLILDKILSLACEAIATLGANLLDLVAGSDHFRKLLKDNLCPDASNEDLYDALKGIMDAVTGPEASCLETITNAEIGSFIDDISLMLTQGQVIQLLTNTANEETIRLALEVAATSDSECIREIFSNPDAIIAFFAGLGFFIPNLDELADVLAEGADTRNVYPCPDDIADIINDLRCDLLSQKGLTPEQCREQIDDLKDQAIQDLKDLADIMQNGPLANFPPLLSDRDCPSDGFYLENDPLLEDLNVSVATALFERIEESHLQDLMGPINLINGRGGVLNAILSDTRGRPWRHHNWLVGSFGSPLSQDLGLFEFYSDNSIRDPVGGRELGPDKAIDLKRNELKRDQGDFGISIGGVSYGGFPPTVGAWLSKQLADLQPVFKSALQAEGFASPEAAADARENAILINQEIVSRRLAYLDAFFEEFNFDGRTTFPQKFLNAKAGMINAAYGQIFLPEPANLLSNPGWTNESDQNRVWNALRGNNVSVAGQLVGTKPVKNWGQAAKDILEKAGIPTDINQFTDAYPNSSRLVPVPAASANDITLSFKDFGDDPDRPGTLPLYQFELQYNYNLLDEEGLLNKGTEYAITLEVTYTSPSGGGPAARRARKRARQGNVGGEEIPPSIVDEDQYTFKKFEIISAGALGEEVIDYLNSALGVILNGSGRVIRVLEPSTGAPTTEELEGATEAATSSQQGALGDYKDLSGQGGSGSAADWPLVRTDSGNFTSYQIETMYKFFSLVLLEATNDVDLVRSELDREEVREYFSEPFFGSFDRISRGFFKRVARSIATGRSDIIPGAIPEDQSEEDFLEGISPGFYFGYDPEEEPTIKYLDPSKYGSRRVQRLIESGRDPETLPKPFYVEPQAFTGWVDLANKMIPEVDGCEPARKPIFKLDDIVQQSSKLSSQLKIDPRLSYDPICVQEAPYDKILEKGPASNVDGAIRAIVRIYVIDVLIRATPAFVMFGLTNENYEDLLPSYIAERIRQGLIEDGRLFNGRNDNTYYYRVLEQCYNSVRRKIQSGLIDTETDFTLREKQASAVIEREILDFYETYSGKEECLSSTAISTQNYMKKALSPQVKKTDTGFGFGLTSFNKKQALGLKKIAFEESIRKTEKEALVFLERYIREEFDSLSSTWSKSIPSYVENIDYLFLSTTWINGGILVDGPFDVQSDPTDSGKYNIEEYSVEAALPPFMEALNDIIGELYPFVLEKYIRIEDKTVPPTEVSERSPNLYNIVNIGDWNEYIQSLPDTFEDRDISELWGNVPLEGETSKIEDHTHTYEVDVDGNGRTSTHTDQYGNQHFHNITNGVLQKVELVANSGITHRHEIQIAGWKFGLRMSYLIEDGKKELFEQMIDSIPSDKILLDKTYKLESLGGTKYIIPIANAELPIPDQNVKAFDPESYDVYCLIEELLKTVEYKTWFRYMFPLTRYTSIMAIYVAEGFFASLGSSGFPNEGGDLWEVPGGRRSAGPSFRKWARSDEDVYNKSRSDARDIFTTQYDTAASIDFQSENKYNHKSKPNSIRAALRPLTNFDDGLRWWQRGRQLKRRPLDKDGEECDE